jgi:hypothetical protein
MLDVDLMKAVAEQLLTEPEVEVAGSRLRIRRVGHGSLRTVRFAMNGRDCEAIEQNPEKPSRWGQLARAGHKVVQFKDTNTNRYIAVAVDGAVTEYAKT